MSRRPSNSNQTPFELQRRYNERQLSLGVLGTCVLSVWRHDMSPISVFHVQRAIQELRAADAQAKIVLVSVVERDCAVPASEPVASAWCDMLKRNQGIVVGTALAYDREGFWSASMRGMVIAVNAESKAGIPHVVTQSVQAACSWAADLLAAGPSASALAQAVAQLRDPPLSSGAGLTG